MTTATCSGAIGSEAAGAAFKDTWTLVTLQDIWADIGPISSRSKERIGYPTQKPLALLERIIKASSNEGDVVLDPFCGCATALVAAETLNRQWIGIDLSSLAVQLVLSRLQKAADDGALLASGWLPEVLPLWPSSARHWVRPGRRGTSAMAASSRSPCLHPTPPDRTQDSLRGRLPTRARPSQSRRSRPASTPYTAS